MRSAANLGRLCVQASGELQACHKGDCHVVNCLEQHPHLPLVLATSGGAAVLGCAPKDRVNAVSSVCTSVRRRVRVVMIACSPTLGGVVRRDRQRRQDLGADVGGGGGAHYARRAGAHARQSRPRPRPQPHLCAHISESLTPGPAPLPCVDSPASAMHDLRLLPSLPLLETGCTDCCRSW